MSNQIIKIGVVTKLMNNDRAQASIERFNVVVNLGGNSVGVGDKITVSQAGNRYDYLKTISTKGTNQGMVIL